MIYYWNLLLTDATKESNIVLIGTYSTCKLTFMQDGAHPHVTSEDFPEKNIHRIIINKPSL